MSCDDISILPRLLMKELNILNVYQINILQHFFNLCSKLETA